jgi:hypothetical protein
MVVRYADNIYKGFATALAIVLSGLIESRIFPNSFLINTIFLAGATLVFASSVMFSVVSRRDAAVSLEASTSTVVGAV